MQIILNTENNTILIQDTGCSLVIHNGSFSIAAPVTDEKGNKTLKTDTYTISDDDKTLFSNVISTSAKIIAPYIKKKGVSALTYSNGIFAIIDDFGNLTPFLETALSKTKAVKTAISDFKDMCERIKPGYTTITYKVPGILSIDEVKVDTLGLTGDDKIIFENVSSVVVNILNS